jgi:hypothetical protein
VTCGFACGGKFGQRIGRDGGFQIGKPVTPDHAKV